MKKLLALLLCLLCGCGIVQKEVEAVPLPPVEEDVPEVVQVPAEEAPELPEEQKSSLRENANFTDRGELSLEQSQLILDYMRGWYRSLALLERQDVTDLFVPDTEKSLKGNMAVWDYIIGLRQLPERDMSLMGYSIRLSVERWEEEDGSLMVLVSEDSVQNFASLPGVDTESFDVYHLFLLEEMEDGSWKIREHFQLDSLYRTVLGSGYFRSEERREALKAFFSDGAGSRRNQNDDEPEELRHETLEEEIQSLLIEAQIETGSRRRKEVKALEAEEAYDREAAVAYAEQWVGQRNEEWPDYAPYGGNCQNFVSQCLYAGGIPMDVRSPGVWKWYSSTPNALANQQGRSPSWSAVKDFLDYVEVNGQHGLVALADAPYYSGEVGDVIHLAAEEGDWKHTVLITSVLKNEAGETCDYLIHSNTADLKNFPVSIYPYPRQLLIKIYGWNR